MKKNIILVSLIISLMLTIVPQVVFAEDSSPAGVRKIQEKIQDIKANIQERKQDKKVDFVTRVRTVTLKHAEQLEKIINLESRLLDKLQIRISKAQAAGKDVTEINKTMDDARAKLADARNKLAEAKTKIDVSTIKTEFKTVQDLFKVVKKDLHDVRVDASKIIRALKGFNSATSSGKNPQAEGTSPGTKK